ncbi:hypothetical protein BDW22DRAFT_91739 [Trametopsis cervina]|nr:hypothetical protein BDW22DRAFT_91739 [Trametopsis cervina]
MPKEFRRRNAAHAQSARLKKQQPVDHDVEPSIVPSTAEDEAVLDLEELAEVAPADEDPRKPLKKKAKQALKHEIFIQRLEASRSPYSKSHERRVKRKAREQVAGGLQEITDALAEVESDVPVLIQQDVSAEDGQPSTGASRKFANAPGQIGEGKPAPLKKSQRKKALQAERLRIPLILSNPEFAANPFQTIRTHAQNTLVRHEGAR